MSGEGILLDTNAVIYFLEGRQAVAEAVLLAPAVFYSPITEIELLSAPHLNDEEAEHIRNFLATCRVVELAPDVVAQTIALRRRYRIKVPDAIVAASALVMDVPLVTADKAFDRVEGLRLVTDIQD